MAGKWVSAALVARWDGLKTLTLAFSLAEVPRALLLGGWGAWEPILGWEKASAIGSSASGGRCSSQSSEPEPVPSAAEGYRGRRVHGDGRSRAWQAVIPTGMERSGVKNPAASCGVLPKEKAWCRIMDCAHLPAIHPHSKLWGILAFS
ncbi:MAG: hypothetical protein PVH50_12970, partial [Anaerolineae bacterium]